MPRITRHILNKPEYLFRPRQIWRRIFMTRASRRNALIEVELPWGLFIKCHSEDVIGACIQRMGIYDLCVCETIWRLLDEGEFAIDVGANIGQMTGLMAARVGKRGSVLALEPHPDVVRELTANVCRWQERPDIGELAVLPAALSSQAGEAALKISGDFSVNRGTASLEHQSGVPVHTCVVETLTLDNVIEERSGDTIKSVGLMKIDVEGHEHSVLAGGKRQIQQGNIRDIIFEEHLPYPTPVTNLLKASGYTLFELRKTIFRVVPEAPGGVYSRNIYEPRNYLATRDPARAKARLRDKGWTVLKAGR